MKTIKYLKSNNSQNGIAIVMVMLIMAVLALSSSSIFYLSSAFNEGSLQTKLRQQTQYAAEAGLQEGLRWLESRAVIGGHWSIENDADSIQITSLGDQEQNCLGSFGYAENQEGVPIESVFIAHRIGPKRMRANISEELDDLRRFSNYTLIQKTAENFFMLESNRGDSIWLENQLHLDPEPDSHHLYSLNGIYHDASDVGTSLDAFTLELWITIPAEAALEDQDLFYLIDGSVPGTAINKIRIKRMSTSGRIEITIGDTVPSNQDTTLTLRILPDIHYHLAISWEQDNDGIVYLNNEQEPFNINDASIPGGQGRIILVKDSNAGISGMRFWDRHLTAEEIFQNSRVYIKTNDSLLNSYYFNSADQAGHGNNAYPNILRSHSEHPNCEGSICELSYMDEVTWEQDEIINDLTSINQNALVAIPFNRVAESSYFKILSCGIGPNDTMVSMESMFQFESFTDISAKKIGEKFL